MASTPNSRNRSKGDRLTADTLSQQLTQLVAQYKIKTWYLAYSGGVDSQVLLHLLKSADLDIQAVYIDHGLQAESAEWSAHCAYHCQQYNIPFRVIQVNAKPAKGESPEAAARIARYSEFKKLITPASCLLTAQHRDDQAETVLLQLLRGASSPGLAAMPDMIPFSEGWHYRPLLDASQQQILDYAAAHNLTWVEDPSNQHQQYDRNYLRHSVIPVIKQRWPAINKTLSMFASQQAENAELLEVLAADDLQAALSGNKNLNNDSFSSDSLNSDTLNIEKLKKLSDARLRNVLRFWLKSNHSPMPSRAVLEQIVQQLQSVSHDTQSLVCWADVEVRRFKDTLYLLEKADHDAGEVYTLSGSEALFLTSINKTLQLKPVKSAAGYFLLTADILTMPLSVRFRQGGERITPAGRQGSHDLKSLFQEAEVPVWQRNKIPLLYAGDKLIAVTGYWLADEFATQADGLKPVLT